MRCPSCGYQESKVVDSRSADDGASIRRRRECLQCGPRFTTYERLAENPILVIKADGSSEVFNREAHARLLIACAKRSHHAREDRRTHHEHRGGIAIESAQRDQIARFGRFGTGPSGHSG